MFSRLAPFFLPVLLAVPACATAEATEGGAAAPVDDRGADLQKGPQLDESKFPMSAVDFRKEMDERRARFEAMGKKHRDARPDADPAREAKHKARFEEHQAEMKAKVDAICADGTVTLEEAKGLRGSFGPKGHGGPGGPGGPGGHHGPGSHGEMADVTFPLSADVFRQKVEARRTEMKARFEEHAKEMPAEKVTEIRGKIAETEGKINAKLAEITADGTVTKEEAEALRGVAFEGFKRRDH